MAKLFNSENDKLDLTQFRKVIDSVGKNKNIKAFKNLIIADGYIIASTKKVIVFKPINIKGRYYVSPADFKKIKSIADLKKYMKPIMPELSGVNFLRVINSEINGQSFKIKFPKLIQKSEYFFWYNNYLYTKYDDWFVGREELALNGNLPAFLINNSTLLFKLFNEKIIDIQIPEIINYSNFSKTIEVKCDECKYRFIISNVDKFAIRNDWKQYYGDELKKIWEI